MRMDAEDLARMNRVLRHRLRNTSSGIRSATTLLSRELAEFAPPSVLEYFPLIIKECEDLADLTRRLGLLFDTSPNGGVMPVERLGHLLMERTREKHPWAGMALDCPQSVRALRIAGADSVFAALLEILDNAVESGGDVPVRCEWLVSGGALVCEVTSFGPPPEDCERIFMPFYTTRSRHVGIGLTIARKLVSDLGGTVHAETSGDAGLVVRTAFPEPDATETD